MSVFSSQRPVSAQKTAERLIRENSERFANRELLKNQQLLEAEEARRQAEMSAEEEKQKKKQERENVLEEMRSKKRVEDSKRAIIEASVILPKIAKEQVLRKVFFGIVNESLWVDDQVKNSPTMQSQAWDVFDEMITKCNAATGTNMVDNMGNSKLLCCIDDIVGNVSACAVNRIMTEAKEAEQITINFNLSSEEEDELNEKIGSLGSKELSNAIKKKVLAVVKDEKEAGKVKSDLFKELDDAANDDENESGDAADSDLVESLIHLPVNQIMETLITDPGSLKNCVDGVRILTAVADKSAINKDFAKASSCYKEVTEQIHNITSNMSVQSNDDMNYAHLNLMRAVNGRQFSISPGTGRAKKVYDCTSAVCCENYADTAKALINYCESMTKACNKTNVLTETASETKQRLLRENANRALMSTIGSTIFESLMIRNMCNVEKSGAVFENGMALLESEKQNAALLQSVLEYTILETFNTMRVYKFNKDVLSRLKTM